jgi:hypothetical protein
MHALLLILVRVVLVQHMAATAQPAEEWRLIRTCLLHREVLKTRLTIITGTGEHHVRLTHMEAHALHILSHHVPVNLVGTITIPLTRHNGTGRVLTAVAVAATLSIAAVAEAITLERLAQVRVADQEVATRPA